MNSTPDSPTHAELADYLAGALDAQATARVEQWCSAKPERIQELALLRSVLAPTHTIHTSPNLGATLRDCAATTPAGSSRPVFRAPPHGSRTRRWSAVIIGAGAAVIVGAVGLVTQSHWSPSAEREVPSQTFVTQRAQRAVITIDPGVEVTLAPETRLLVLQAGHETHVTLVGEAKFVVTPNASAPLLVRAGNTTTKVLGTTFGVRKYPQDPNVRVAVQDGRVASNAIVVSAGEVATLAAQGSVEVVQDRADDVLRWTSGVLSFQAQPLHEVAVELSRWYANDVLIGDPAIARRRVTGRFQRTDLESVVHAIARATGARVERQGNSFVLQSH